MTAGRGTKACAPLNVHRIERPSCLENPRPQGGILTNGLRQLSSYGCTGTVVVPPNQTVLAKLSFEFPNESKLFSLRWGIRRRLALKKKSAISGRPLVVFRMTCTPSELRVQWESSHLACGAQIYSQRPQ